MKHGQAAAAIIEELLRAGTQTASKLIMRAYDAKVKTSITEHRDAFNDLCQSNYIFRAPTVKKMGDSEAPPVPRFEVNEHTLFAAPDVDLQEIMKLKSDDTITTKDAGLIDFIFYLFNCVIIKIIVYLDIYWLVNMDRFHQDFRDTIMTSAIERKIDANASECMKYVLQQMYVRTKPWLSDSNPIPMVEIRQLVERKSTNAELIKYLDQYISIISKSLGLGFIIYINKIIIVDDQLKFLAKFGDMGGGQYIVQMKYAIDQLVWTCIENIITEKFGSKASRIFR